MKRLTSILLFALFFLSQAGYFFIYSLQQQQIRKEMKARILAAIPDSAFQVIELTDEVKWEEQGREFHYRNEMYDVARIRKANGKTLIYCLNDKQEKQLLKGLANIAKTGSGQGKKLVKMNFKFQAKTNSLEDFRLDPPQTQHSFQLTEYGTSPLLSPYIQGITPPPRSC